MIAGIFQEGATTMHLSRGLGEMMPIRWRCRPEITKVILE
jgi:predicted MPP superfamily phosphohydrolase